VAAALANPRVYLFAFVYFSLTCASLTLNFWMPLMIRDFGVTDVVAVSLYTVVPNAVGAVGLILIARRSDRTGERRRHFACCTLGGALALAALTLHLHSFAAMLACLSIAATLIFAALPIFWAVPTRYLSGNAAAAGIADQQHRDHERHRQPVGDRDHPHPHRQHGSRRVPAGRAARAERRRCWWG
jgi:sugar phosphate permease